jgi:hypothetical protein
VLSHSAMLTRPQDGTARPSQPTALGDINFAAGPS